MKKSASAMLLFFGAVAVLFTCISLFTTLHAAPVAAVGGVADLTSLDLSTQIAAVRPWGMEFYPNLHLKPGEFEGAPPPRAFTDADKSEVQ